MKNFRYIIIALLISFGCSEKWLEPDPKSFFSPENTFTDKAGLEAVLVSLNRSYRNEYATGDQHFLMGNGIILIFL